MFDLENIRVYCDSDTSRYHFDQLANLKFNDSNYHKFELDNVELDKFIESVGTKVAGFHVPFPPNTAWLDRLHKIYDQCSGIYVFCSEMHADTVDQLKTLDLPKITFFVSGMFNFQLNHAKVYHWLDWLYTTGYFYTKTHPNFLDARLSRDIQKPKSFDILLGSQRPHRDVVFDYIENNNLTDHAIIKYARNPFQSKINNDDFVLETEGVEFDADKKYANTIERVTYYGASITLSQIMALQIYNQTAYSLVAETNFSNEFNFYTEKIAKPMLAQRLFVAVAGRHYLKNLRAIGFQTFGNVIDESYDDMDNDQQRWAAALAQVEYLMSCPQEIIAQKIKPIVEHNYSMFVDRDFYREFSNRLELTLIDDAKISPTGTT